MNRCNNDIDARFTGVLVLLAIAVGIPSAVYGNGISMMYPTDSIRIASLPETTVGVRYSEKPRVYQFGENTCYFYRRYIVRVRPASHGDDIFVIPRPDADVVSEEVCRTNERTADFSFASKGTLVPWFYGLEYKYLFVDTGTGPGPRGLKVFDLESGEVLYDGMHIGLPWASEGPHLIFYEPLEDVERPCPREEQWVAHFGTGFEELVVLELSHGELKRSGAIRCSARQ